MNDWILNKGQTPNELLVDIKLVARGLGPFTPTIHTLQSPEMWDWDLGLENEITHWRISVQECVELDITPKKTPIKSKKSKINKHPIIVMMQLSLVFVLASAAVYYN